MASLIQKRRNETGNILKGIRKESQEAERKTAAAAASIQAAFNQISRDSIHIPVVRIEADFCWNTSLPLHRVAAASVQSHVMAQSQTVSVLEQNISAWNGNFSVITGNISRINVNSTMHGFRVALQLARTRLFAAKSALKTAEAILAAELARPATSGPKKNFGLKKTVSRPSKPSNKTKVVAPAAAAPLSGLSLGGAPAEEGDEEVVVAKDDDPELKKESASSQDAAAVSLLQLNAASRIRRRASTAATPSSNALSDFVSGAVADAPSSGASDAAPSVEAAEGSSAAATATIKTAAAFAPESGPDLKGEVLVEAAASGKLDSTPAPEGSVYLTVPPTKGDAVAEAPLQPQPYGPEVYGRDEFSHAYLCAPNQLRAALKGPGTSPALRARLPALCAALLKQESRMRVHRVTVAASTARLLRLLQSKQDASLRQEVTLDTLKGRYEGLPAKLQELVEVATKERDGLLVEANNITVRARNSSSAAAAVAVVLSGARGNLSSCRAQVQQLQGRQQALNGSLAAAFASLQSRTVVGHDRQVAAEEVKGKLQGLVGEREAEAQLLVKETDDAQRLALGTESKLADVRQRIFVIRSTRYDSFDDATAQ